MRKRKSKGGLIKVQLKASDIVARQAPEGYYRVIGVDNHSQSVWVEGTYQDFKSAKMIVDNKASDSVQYYVHSDSNRILYRG
jgi:hypothetical protein